MRFRKKFLSAFLSLAMVASMGLTGCGKSEEETTNKETTTKEETTEAPTEVALDENFVELALYVLYNDDERNYFNNEVSPTTVKVTEEGQYTLEFDCDNDLSDDAKNAGITNLANLTAIYIKDKGIETGEQSNISACDITYDEIKVNDQALTITKTDAKSAIKDTGEFDTNDPVNSWDGSAVEEAEDDLTNHKSNFPSIDDPKKISVTFTLSNIEWGAGDDGPEAVKEFDLIPTDYSDLSEYTALEVSKMMGNGINLGNTMEACDVSLGTDADVSSYESCWGQPITTENMIKGIRASGFDTIRIPVAWFNKTAYEDGDYTISEDYLDRVAQIVDWSIDAGLFVVLNEHWDSGWMGRFGSGTKEVREAAMEQYKSMWTQIADKFKDYPDNLIFESTNEDLGDGLNQPDKRGSFDDPGALSGDEKYEVSNEINQAFVDVVRASGGNNDDRFLLIAGINTNFDKTLDDRFVMPKDTAEKKLFVSVHYYDPADYCLDKSDSSINKHWGTVKEYENMNAGFEKLTKLTDEGYGVIIGEYGALKMPDGSLMYDTVNYHSNLLDNCDIYNYVPILWDTGMFYDKAKCVLADQEVLDLYQARTYAVESETGDEEWIKASKQHMEDQKAAAPETFNEETVEVNADEAVAWIMWNGGAGTYSVGDVYDPNSDHPGIIPTDVVVDGEGTYTVGLEFEGGNTGLMFAAVGLSNGEDLFPGGIIDIKEICVDGKPIDLIATPYTSSDDEHCTRVNLVNIWVPELPDDARTVSGDLTGCDPVILDIEDMNGINSITVTFDFVLP